MKRIIDKRKKEKYMLDDEYLNGMAKLCGWQGTIVYNSLCRHADKDQKCFPSLKLMADQHGVSRPTILKGLKQLEDRNVIEIKKTRSKGGQWLNNEYILLDKSGWKYDQVNVVDMVHQVNENTPPSKPPLLDQVNVVDTKETHKQGNTYKETHNSKQSLQGGIVQIIDWFKEYKINAGAGAWYGNKTQRKACEEILKQFDLKVVESAIKILPITNARPRYEFPKVITPKQLLENWHFIEKSVGVKLQASSKPKMI